METWLLGVFLKPFIALIFLSIVWIIAAVINRYMPDSRIKRILFSPLPGHRKS